MKITRSKLFWFTVAVIAVCLALMLWSGVTGRTSFLKNALGAVTTPAENGINAVLDRFNGFLDYFYRYDELKKENEALMKQLEEYRALENDYYSAIHENDALREAAGVKKKHTDFDLEICAVTSVVGNGFQSAITLSRGSNAGILVGDPVITGSGLVGFVSEVSPSYCTVKTVINADFTTSAMISRTRQKIVIMGDFQLAGQGLLKISYLEKRADIRSGDKIVTVGGEYPPNLTVGTVRDFQEENHGISAYASITPLADIDNLTMVFVVKSFQSED